MNETQTQAHTPGPWEVRHLVEIWAADGSKYITKAPSWDASLIAAAPEMYEALVTLVAFHRRDDYVGLAKRYQDLADAAIAKAEGRGAS